MRLRRLLRNLALGLLGLTVVASVAAYLIPLPASPDLDPTVLAPAGTRFVDAAGVRTPVVEAGPTDGPAVVLVHGFGGSTFSWRETLPALGDLGYHAVALDLVDFGLTDKRWDADTRHDAQAAHVLATMDALGIAKAVLVGHSMGGSVVAHVALQAPDRVAGLVLVDAAVRWKDQGGGIGSALTAGVLAVPPFRQIARQLLRRLIDEPRLVGILRSAYADPAFVTSTVADGYAAQIRTPDWDLALLAVSRDMGGSALPIPPGSLGVPTFVVWGERDPWIPLAAGQALRAAIPGAGWAVIPGTGHLPFEEDPPAFLAAIRPFLSTVSPLTAP